MARCCSGGKELIEWPGGEGGPFRLGLGLVLGGLLRPLGEGMMPSKKACAFKCLAVFVRLPREQVTAARHLILSILFTILASETIPGCYKHFFGGFGYSYPVKHVEVWRMDANIEIRRAVDTGKVLFGTRESEYSLKMGEGQVLILPQNTPILNVEKLSHLASLSNVPVYRFNGTALELGSVCGKPFVISSLLVLDQGKSKASELTNAKQAAAEQLVSSHNEEAPAKPKRARKKKAAVEEEGEN